MSTPAAAAAVWGPNTGIPSHWPTTCSTNRAATDRQGCCLAVCNRPPAICLCPALPPCRTPPPPRHLAGECPECYGDISLKARRCKFCCQPVEPLDTGASKKQLLGAQQPPAGQQVPLRALHTCVPAVPPLPAHPLAGLINQNRTCILTAQRPLLCLSACLPACPQRMVILMR